jgi:hypothetical protein
MNSRTSAAKNQSLSRPANADADIEKLARETDMPVELVQKIYSSEREKMERTARIKTYVPVLVHRQVKALLRERQVSS